MGYDGPPVAFSQYRLEAASWSSAPEPWSPKTRLRMRREREELEVARRRGWEYERAVKRAQRDEANRRLALRFVLARRARGAEQAQPPQALPEGRRTRACALSQAARLRP